MAAAERAALRTMVWAGSGCLMALPLLAVPQPDDPLLLVTLHLSALVLFGLGLVFALAPLGDESWFGGNRWLTGVWTVVMVTGAVGIVTLATSAALRYDPSLQFLQSLSALDIAWAAAALVLGLRWWRGRSAAIAGAFVLGVVCVWSIWRYLDVVGFGAGGEWVVDGSRIISLVLPFDMAAAAMAVTALVLGVRAQR
jgi:hypothetical protein